MNRETRTITADFELRAAGDGESPQKIVGYAAVFNQLSASFGSWQEKIAPGAFAAAILEDDVRALINHDSNLVLGRNGAGTLVLSEDEIGLRVEITPPDTQAARDIATSIKRGDVTQMSFGFTTKKDSWDFTGDIDIRTLEEVSLFDISVVTYPAYPDTTVAVRSHELAMKEQRHNESVDNWWYESKMKLAEAELAEAEA